MIFSKKAATTLYSLLLAILIFPPSAYTQKTDTLRMRESISGKTFRDIANEIDHEYGIKVLYEPSWVKGVEVGIPIKGKTISELLQTVLARKSLTYEVFDEHHIVILPVSINFGENGTQADANGILRIGNPAEKGKHKRAEISGQVLEGATGMPIPGAIVYIEETKQGITTDKEGKFKLTLPSGNYTLRFSFVGLEERKQSVEVISSGNLNIELYEKSVNLQEVVVRETHKDHNVSGTEMSNIRIDARSLQKLPVLMGETDVVKSLTLLPGVVSTGEGSGGFNVRGGNSDQNLILMDDAPIFNASHLFGMFSVINPDAVKDVSLMKGDIPAKFGGRTSSVMNISMKSGNYKGLHVSGGIGLLNSKIMVDGPFANKKGSFLLGGRSTYSDWLLQRLSDINLRNSKAGFYDLNGKLNFTAGANDHFSLMAYGNSDNFNFAGTTRYEYSNKLGSLNWGHYYSSQTFSSLSLTYSKYQFQLSDQSVSSSAYTMNSYLEDFGFKPGLTFQLWQNHQFGTGLDISYNRFNPGIFNPYGSTSLAIPLHLENEYSVTGAAYISDDWTLSNRISLSLGIRFSYFANLGPGNKYIYESGQTRSDYSIIDSIHYPGGKVIQAYHALEPRLGLKIGIDEASSVKVSYNRNTQYLHLLSNSAAVAPTDMWRPSGPYLKPQKSDQFAAGYYRNFNDNNIETSVELYYKLYTNLTDYKNGASLFMNQHIETALLNSKGKAYGIEFLAKKNNGRLTGWGGLTLSRSLISTKGEFPEETILNGKYYPTSYDKPVDLTMAMNYQLTRRWRVSGNFVYNTGRPVTLPELSYMYNGSQMVYYSDRNSIRVPDYHRLDLSVSIDGNLRKYRKWKSSWTFSVINLYGRKNVFSVFYAKNSPYDTNATSLYNLYQMSIIGRPFPSLTFNFTF